MRKNNILIVVACLFIILIGWFAGLKDLLSNVETIMYDWRAKIAVDAGPFNSGFSHSDPNIILLTDDQNTNDKLNKYVELGIGRWPWPRKTWGDVITFINNGKPKAIVFDIKFEGSEGYGQNDIYSDKYMSEVLKKNKNVIIGIAMSSPRVSIAKEVELLSQRKKLNNDQLDFYIYKLLKLSSSVVKKSLSLNIDDSLIKKTDSRDKNTQNFLNNITFYGNSAISSEILESSSYIGAINLKTGNGLVSREHSPLYRLAKSNTIQYIPSLPLSTVIALSEKGEQSDFKLYLDRIESKNRVIPLDGDGKFLINWHGAAGTYKNISIAKVLLSDAYEKGKLKKINQDEKISSSFFKDKIVVIGQTAPGTDFHPTPMGMVYPGTEIIATSIDNLLHDTLKGNKTARKFLKNTNFISNLLIVLLFCSAIVVFTIKARSNVLSLVYFFLIVFLFIIFALILFVHPQLRIAVNMTYPLIFMIIASISSNLYKIYVGRQDKKQIENLFGKFVSPQVLEKLLKDPKSVSREGQRKIMTVLFSDIRGFTSLSEKIPPDQLISQLNEYMTEMVEVILKYNGTLDKYIGDAIMAFYGDPLPMKDHALRAVLTAIDMMKSLNSLNAKWKIENRPILDIGLGINTGEMIVGHMGSPRLLDYTVIGDNVNLASRLEGLNKEYKTNIIISESTYEQVKEFINAEYLDECKVKGKVNAVKIYSVVGIKDGVQVENFFIKAF